MVIFGIILFLSGLIFGSFLNSLIFRINSNHLFSGRSFCPKCKKQIAWYDNIPIASFLLLKGRCRKCRKQISIQYPIIELIVSFVFIIIGLYSPSGKAVTIWFEGIPDFEFLISNQFPSSALLSLALLLTSCFLLLAIAIYDAKTKYVLVFYAYAAALFAIFYQSAEFFRLGNELSPINIFSYGTPFVLAAVTPFGIFWLVSKLSKEKFMGSGDADIALAIGFLLGWPKIIPAYYFAFLVGAAWGIYLMLTKKANMKSEVPFGPFLVSGAFFSILFGEQLIGWYGKIFLSY